MSLPKKRAVQFLKATYGLTVAPREWFLKGGWLEPAEDEA